MANPCGSAVGNASVSVSSPGAVCYLEKGRRFSSFSAMFIFSALIQVSFGSLQQCGARIFAVLLCVSPGIFGRNPFSTAVFKQLIVGEPSVAWAYARCSSWGSAVSRCDAVQLCCQKICLVLAGV